MNVVPTYGPIAGRTRITIIGGYFGEYGPIPQERYEANDEIHIAFGDPGKYLVRGKMATFVKNRKKTSS